MCTSEPYVVAPKPVGPRCLLFIDSSGRVFIENMTQHIFRMEDRYAFEMFNNPTITDTVLDGIFSQERSNTTGKWTYWVQDAIRCNGEDLTGYGILKRMAVVKEKLVNVFESKASQQWIFNFDVAEYKEFHLAEEYLDEGFNDRFKYQLRSLNFFLTKKGYKCGTCQDIFQWTENDPQTSVFRLKIPKGSEESKDADLLVVGPNGTEIPFNKIALTDEIRQRDGCIINCNYFDHRWIFVELRMDRQHPNGKRVVLNKMKSLENPVERHHLLTSLEHRHF